MRRPTSAWPGEAARPCVDGMDSRCPMRMWFGLRIPFAEARAVVVVPLRAAMPERVSPRRTS
jgi:hypothetical protein